MTDCVFCKIISGERTEFPLYEDGEVYAFLDAYPLSRGHTLVIPKRHVTLLEELSPGEVQHLFKVVHALIPVLKSAVEAPATTVAVNNGRQSGQQVPHTHVHIIPRRSEDKGTSIHSLIRDKPKVSRAEIQLLAEEIGSQKEGLLDASTP